MRKAYKTISFISHAFFALYLIIKPNKMHGVESWQRSLEENFEKNLPTAAALSLPNTDFLPSAPAQNSAQFSLYFFSLLIFSSFLIHFWLSGMILSQTFSPCWLTLKFGIFVIFQG